jgi:hypothetical protein
MVDAPTSPLASPRLSGLSVVLGVLSVISLHVVAVLLLYPRGRLVSSTGIPAELIVFLLPAALGFSSYLWLLRARKIRLMPPWVGAFLLTLLSFWLSLLLPFNIYGT